MLTAGWSSNSWRWHHKNEDALCVLMAEEAPLDADVLVAVADGVGGLPAGDLASKLAIRQFTDHLLSRAQDSVSWSDRSSLHEAMHEALMEANRSVLSASSSLRVTGIASTLTAVAVRGSCGVVTHVGDSRAYLLRSGSLQQLTRDHRNLPAYAGPADPPVRDVGIPVRITRAIGVSRDLETDNSTFKLMTGDRIVLCSDGVHGVLADELLASLASVPDTQDACDGVIAEVHKKGGTDDASVIILEFSSRTEAVDHVIITD